MKRMTVGKKIACGFAVVLLLLAVLGVSSFLGTSKLVENTNQTIVMNDLNALLAEKEIDHLNWASKVSELLTNDAVTELDVETDDHECAFGKWLYSEARDRAEKEIPELEGILEKIEGVHYELHASAIEVDEHFQQADAELPATLAARKVDHLAWADAIRDSFLHNAESIDVQVDPTQCALGKWLNSDDAKKVYENGTPEFRETWDEMLEVHKKLHESVIGIQEQYVRIHPGLEQLLLEKLIDHKNWAERVSEAIIQGDAELDVETDPNKCAFGKFLSSPECAAYQQQFPALQEALKASHEPHEQLHESAVAISAALTKGASGKAEAERIYREETLPALQSVGTCLHSAIEAESQLRTANEAAYQVFNETTVPLLEETLSKLSALEEEAITALAGMKMADRVFIEKTKPALLGTQKLLKEATDKVKSVVAKANEDTLATGLKTKISVSVLSTVAFVLGIILAFVIARGIIVSLKRIVSSLSAGADQVAAASQQVAQSSQQLAEGASEQASSLEETSASLEEMTAMTRQNADNASQANLMSTEASSGAEKGRTAMRRMSGAIDTIKTSSDETAKIIKTIDEIAFQTNLLALNAAVEAARAGDAGKGFAVVAEEVRSLAQRSAEAARTTNELIEQSQQNADNGVAVCREVSELLEGITSGVGKVTQLVGEVSAASGEQSQGIDQVNVAVSQMDQVTQNAAAVSEESAAASEELSAQAQQLNDTIRVLDEMVGSSGTNGASRKENQRAPIEDREHSLDNPLHKTSITGGNGSKKEPGVASGVSRGKPSLPAPEEKVIAANDVIPLDDEDLRDF